MATLTSRSENVASLEARRTSHALTRSSPPPMQAPCTAAMTGTGHRGDGVERALEAADQRQEVGPGARAAAGEEGPVLLEGGGEIEAVGEGLRARPDHDGAHLGVVGDAAEGGLALGEERRAAWWCRGA